MNDRLADDLMIGLREIGEEIGRTPRQAQHLIHTGEIPAFRLGGKWAAFRSTVRRCFERKQQAAEAAGAAA